MASAFTPDSELIVYLPNFVRFKRSHADLLPGDVLIGGCCSANMRWVITHLLRVVGIEGKIATMLVGLASIIQIVDDDPLILLDKDLRVYLLLQLRYTLSLCTMKLPRASLHPPMEYSHLLRTDHK